MRLLMNIFTSLFYNINENLSNYLLILGVILILIFIYMSFGIAPTILGIGIFLILFSILIELSNKTGKKYR